MHDDPGTSLRIARLQRVTSALGPGRRAVVWFHGCALSCPGCVAANMNAALPTLSMRAHELVDWLRAIPDIVGVTLSGGDPLDQALDALATFVERVRDTTPLDIMLYTGRTLAQLRARRDADVERVLAAVDLLVDAPYIEALNDGAGWRGSGNQVVHRLTARGVAAAAEPSRRRFEVTLDADGTLFMAGLPAAGRAAPLRERLLAAASGGTT